MKVSPNYFGTGRISGDNVRRTLKGPMMKIVRRIILTGKQDTSIEKVVWSYVLADQFRSDPLSLDELSLKIGRLVVEQIIRGMQLQSESSRDTVFDSDVH